MTTERKWWLPPSTTPNAEKLLGKSAVESMNGWSLFEVPEEQENAIQRMGGRESNVLNRG